VDGLNRNLDGTLLARGVIYTLISLDALVTLSDLDDVPHERVQRERDDLVHLLCLMIQDEAHRDALAAEVERMIGVLPDITDWIGRH
jgi:hypothetical protein